jgi:ABC-type sugar transport system substrate-binding protein
MNAEKSKAAITSYLENHSDVDGIVGLDPTAAEPALQAIDRLGKTGQIKVCTFLTLPPRSWKLW